MHHLKQSELMVDWCASVLDTGSLGKTTNGDIAVRAKKGVVLISICVKPTRTASCSDAPAIHPDAPG
jgi:hypothetical protein